MVENFFWKFLCECKIFGKEFRNILFFVVVVGKNVIGDEERGLDL